MNIQNTNAPENPQRLSQENPQPPSPDCPRNIQSDGSRQPSPESPSAADHGRKVLDLVSAMGETLLLNGAEIARVQTTMEMVAAAYHNEEIDVFAISNGIFVTLRQEDKTRCTQVKHVPLSGANLGKVAMINQLSREIVEQHLSLDSALERMHHILETPSIPFWLEMAACGVGAASFCYLFGGNFQDSLAAIPVGLLLCFCQRFIRRGKLSKMIQTVLESSIVTLSGLLIARLLPGINMDKIVIGGLIILVPGVPFTSSIRDFFNGDYLSGTIRLIDALLTAVCMAIGVGIVYTLFI